MCLAKKLANYPVVTDVRMGRGSEQGNDTGDLTFHPLSRLHEGGNKMRPDGRY